jgi:hypothetical protein
MKSSDQAVARDQARAFSEAEMAFGLKQGAASDVQEAREVAL